LPGPESLISWRIRIEKLVDVRIDAALEIIE